ncbi:HET-domain-containing protein, partial [Cadophora sp. DSE1049]
AKKWIKTCVKDHKRCPKSLYVPLPKRLVDVGSRSREPSLKLCNNMKGRYAALSYCWGKTETLKTQRWNMEAHTKQIPMLSLPRSLQDAVTVTRMLGIQYLWIDALCIIQDDVADWNEQSAAMYDIYRHSYVTISATSAQDAETSWLENRENGSAPVKLARAWTLQERILSPRVLHFGAHQMVLECETCTVSEAGIDKVWGPLYGEATTYISRHSRKMGRNPKDRLLLCWYELLKEYTKRSLTKEEDKLVALLGIIDLIRGKISDEIVAGLWRTDIPRGLCWIVLDNAHSRRPSTPRAPSWSWLVMDGRLGFADKLVCDLSCEITKCET